MKSRGEYMEGEYTKSSRGRSGKWKHNPPIERNESELVIPLEVEPKSPTNIPEILSAEDEVSISGEESSESVMMQEEVVQPAFADIPPEQLKSLEGLLKGRGGWERTPAPILQALKTVGFTVKIAEKGSVQKRGDTLLLSRPHDREVYTYSTDEAVFLLKEIISEQRERATLHALEKESSEAISEVSEVVAEESTLAPAEAVSDAEEQILTPIDVVETSEDGIPVLTDIVSEEELQHEISTNAQLRERAQKVAELRSEMLRDEEERVQEDVLERPSEGVDIRNEKQPVPAQQPRTFDTRFESEFGVTKEIWEQIPGSEKLSPAQQKLVFENLREFNERDKAPFLKHAWEGIVEKLGRKKDVGPTLDALSRLVESAALYGPKVHEENGELLTDFVGIEIPREHRKEWKQAFDALNAAAHRMSKTPASWQEDGIGTHSAQESKMMSFIKDSFSPSRKRYKEYQEIQASYEASKKELSRVLEAAHVDPIIIADRLVHIDKNMYMLQFQQTSPDAVEAIKDIPDANMWKMVGKSLCSKSNLGYMALGAVGRTALAGAMGVFAAPVTSAAIAGGRAWDRSAAEMRERDRAARMGARDTSGEALNIVSAEMTIDIAGEKREVGATQKLQYLIDKYRTLRETNDIEGPPSPRYIKDMNNLLESIRVRASYVEDKQRLNRINFGDREERAVQMAKLYETLALAQMIVADNSAFPKIDEPIPDWHKDKNPKTLEERLASELSKTENIIQGKRRLRQVKEASWHALRAGSFSGAGVYLAGVVEEMGLGEKLRTLIQNDSYKMPEGLSAHDGPLLTAEEIARAEVPLNEILDIPQPEFSDTSPDLSALTGGEGGLRALGSYEIQRGDTLTKIIREQMPGKQMSEIVKILNELSPEELQQIGVRSNNIDLIYAGETINTEALHKIIESHQSILEEAASRASSAASAAQEAMGGNAPEALYTPEPLNVVPQTIETPDVVPVEAEGFGVPAKYEYLAGSINPGEDPNLRTMIFNDAVQNTERWMKLYPRADAHNAISAGIMEGHFKNLFGEKWATAGSTQVTDMLSRGPRFSVENPERMMHEFKTLVETMQKPPMNVVPMHAETMEDYLERVSMAYAQKGDVIPKDNLLRKIEMYYMLKRSNG